MSSAYGGFVDSISAEGGRAESDHENSDDREMKPYYQDEAVTLYCGDVLRVLKGLDDESVNCVVTSPPYWRMRDYHVDGQIGLEENPVEYIEKLVCVFAEVRRVLRGDGTLWVNIGDTYASGGWGVGAAGNGISDNVRKERSSMSGWRSAPVGMKNKDLVGIPWMLAFALRDFGWYLRSEVIWEKPNVLPEAVKDRPTKSHEQIFLFSKSYRYFYDAEAVKVPASPNTHDRGTRFNTKVDGANRKFNRANRDYLHRIGRAVDKRNLRDVWKVPSSDARFQYYAAKRFIRKFLKGGRDNGDVLTVATESYKGAHFATFPSKLIRPCIEAGCPEGGVVLDPFVGSGTTCFVAKQFGRLSIGIDLNSNYLDLAKRRVAQGVLLV